MINELAEMAREIKNTTDSNISGAVVQVTKNLSLDELQTVFVERGSQRLIRQVERLLNNQETLITINDLRNSAYSIVLARVQEEQGA